MSERFDLAKLTLDPQLVARIAAADELFGFFTRERLVPPACVALAYGNGRQPVLVSEGKPIEAAHTNELLVVRSVPFSLEYNFTGIPSSDGYAFDAVIQMAVSVVPERIELEAFRRAIVSSRREVRVDRLRQHCEEIVRAAVVRFIADRKAETLVAATSWNDFDAVLEQLFPGVGFEAGLALGPDPRIDLRSVAYEENRRELQAAALRAERDREDQSRRQSAAREREAHLAELAGMLEKLKSMAGAGGVLNVADIVKTFSIGQRGTLYHGLLAGSHEPRSTAYILAVAGEELLWIEPADLSQPARRQPLPPTAGPLRSVRVVNYGAGRLILVGAKHGVFILNENGEAPRAFTFTPSPELRGGVNAAAVADNALLATHSEVGLIRWNLDNPQTMRLCLTDLTEGSKAVRDVQTDNAGRLWLAVDNIAIGWRADSDAPQYTYAAPCEITALLIADGHAIAGLRDGAVVRWLIGDTRSDMETVRPSLGKPVQSVDWLAGGGVPRLLIADGRPHLDMLVLGDSYTGQYRCLHEVRWGLAADDLIVGVNDRRDTLLVWSPQTPDLPRGALAVRRLIGRSIQDVALM